MLLENLVACLDSGLVRAGVKRVFRVAHASAHEVFQYKREAYHRLEGVAEYQETCKRERFKETGISTVRVF